MCTASGKEPVAFPKVFSKNLKREVLLGADPVGQPSVPAIVKTESPGKKGKKEFFVLAKRVTSVSHTDSRGMDSLKTPSWLCGTNRDG